jgi:hypothetical protein
MDMEFLAKDNEGCEAVFQHMNVNVIVNPLLLETVDGTHNASFEH